MALKNTFHAISKPNIESFNEEFKKYTNDGYTPYGGIAVASVYNNEILCNTYVVILMKTEV